MAISVSDTFKVIDINTNQIPDDVYEFLQDNAVYIDLQLGEHLVSPEQLLDDEEGLVSLDGWQESMRSTLMELKQLQDTHDAAYIRFIEM
jgi:hypothetical protein